MEEKRSVEFKWTFDLAATFTVLGAAYFLSNFQRQMLAVLSDGLISDFGLTNAQFSILGSAIFYPYALMQIPSGYLGDRVSPGRLLFFSSLISAAGAFLFASATQFDMLVIGRILTSIGTAFVYIPALAVLRRTFGDERYGTVTGLFITIASFASMSSSAPLRFVSEYVSRDAIFWTIGFISLGVAIAARFILHDDPTLKPQPSRIDFKAIINPGTSTMVLWFFVMNGVSITFTSVWGSRYLTESIGVTARDASLVLLANSVGGLFGNVICGRISDKIGPLITLSICSTARAAAWFALAFCPPGSPWYAIAPIMICAGFFNSGASTTGFSASKLFVGPENTGLVSGLNNTGTFIGSGLFTMIAAPIMAAVIGGPVAQFRVLFTVFGSLVLAVTMIVLVVNRRHLHR